VKWFIDPVTAAKVQPMMYQSGVEEFIDRMYIPKSMVRMDSKKHILLCCFLQYLSLFCMLLLFLGTS
jgi:hypothetical protein